ncbi:unnamed protein product [Symbiodinium sp. CCMP2456]|nr:unnamed protein product [Symbiodinium sp. CCMP2456]
MAFNVYYAALGREDRMDGIAQAIADMTPDIAVITETWLRSLPDLPRTPSQQNRSLPSEEQWKEKPTILEKIKQKTNKYYAFCLGGPQEKWWDGDILYRADLFEVVMLGLKAVIIQELGTVAVVCWHEDSKGNDHQDSLLPRIVARVVAARIVAMFASPKHKDSGKKVIIYGAHPVCCGNEPIHLQNALDFAEHAKTLASGADVALFLTAGLAFSSSLSIWAWSLTQTSVATATLLHNMMPIFTTLGAWLFFRQTCSRKFVLGMAVAMAGATVIGLEDFQVNRGHLGDAAALLAALLSSVNILVVKQLRHHFEAPTIMMCTCGIGSTFLFILLQVLEDQVFPRTSVSWWAVLCLALFPQALGQGLLAYSLKQFSASLVAVSMLTVPVIAAILARFLFAEQLTLLNWAAFGVVLLGIYLAVSDS